MASCVWIMDLKGKVIIARNYRGDISLNHAETFAKHITEDDEAALVPVLTEEGITFLYVRHNNLLLVAATRQNANAMVILNFLYRVVEVMEEYFSELVEESVRDNFVVTYELLDELMDFGYPQSTDARVLKDFICVQERHRLAAHAKPPVALTTAVSWRPEGIAHKKNEIFLDVIEKLNLLVSSGGTVMRSEILGVLRMKSFLSGMPELKLGLNDKLLMESRVQSTAATGAAASKVKAIEMEDIRFHQCVRLSRFENDRTISFIPPDGEFDLMVYRLSTQVRPLIWIEAAIEVHAHSRIIFSIKALSTFKRRSTANNVEISIPVPPDADSPSFQTKVGRVEYVPAQSCALWRIKQFPGQKDYRMRASFGLPSMSAEEPGPAQTKAPISVKFEIPYFTVSGIQVRYLKIMEKSGYQALPWVRYITQNGDYQIRMN